MRCLALRVSVLLLFGGLAACGEDGFVFVPGELQVPGTFAFGEVAISPDPLTQSASLENDGQNPVVIRSVRLTESGPFRFSIDGRPFTRADADISVAAGTQIGLTVEFFPAEPGTFSDTLEIETDINQSRTFTVQISGAAVDDITCSATAPESTCQGRVLIVYEETDCPGRDEPGWVPRPTDCPSGCDESRAVCASCGDEAIDDGEACDGANLGGATCASEVGGVGTITCQDNCLALDVSACAVCGNGILEGAEVCDGDALADKTCGTEVEGGVGPLGCLADCSALDTSACTVCGDGVTEGDEVCDGGDLEEETCGTLIDGAVGALTCADDCSAFDTDACTVCGDGVAEGDENCDLTDFRDQACPASGVLSCSADCTTIDRSGCYVCGDGVIEGPEVCDGLELSGNSCLLQTGLTQGAIRCSNDCLSFDATGCFQCGNGSVEGPEVCDGANLAGRTCQSHAALADGALACNPNCLGFDVSDCHGCGNNTIEGPEVCDTGPMGMGPPVLAGKTCGTESPFTTGALACAAGCRAFDVRACFTCGNGTVEGAEICDGANLGSPPASCSTQVSLKDGAIACAASCLTFDTSDCHDCGNAVIEGPEACEGTDFGSPPKTCRTETGLRQGDLACIDNCRTIDESGCYQCDNGTIEGPEVCDGTEFGGETCDSQTLSVFTEGDLRCISDCQTIETDQCFTCGNGTIEGPEVCDTQGPDFGGETCLTQANLAEGSLECTNSCSRIDDSGCFECGNGVLEAPAEECDGIALGGETCETQGRPGGNLACDAFCELDFSVCSECGDGICETALGETVSNCAAECAWDLVTPTGSQNVCGIRADETLYCAGPNGRGQIGDGSNAACFLPTVCAVSWPSTAPDPEEVVGSALGAGGEFACAKGTSATGVVSVYCWGGNSAGQLGDGTTTNRNSPVAVQVSGDPEQIEVGERFACGLDSAGTVECWGNNSFGQLGDGTTTRRTTPVAVSNITTATKIALGRHHACALLSSGGVECWGRNGFGELGNGANTNSSTPVSVSSLTDAVDISAGASHTCAVRTGGTVECWGRNDGGALGNGQTRNRNAPVSVTGLTTAVEVELGAGMGCARLTGGIVRCWGAAGTGALGNGSQVGSTTPVAASVSGVQALHGTHAYSGMCADVGTEFECWGSGLGNSTTRFPEPFDH